MAIEPCHRGALVHTYQDLNYNLDPCQIFTLVGEEEGIWPIS